MEFYANRAEYAINALNSDAEFGLTPTALKKSYEKYGINKLTEKKKVGFFSRLFSAMKEPMLIILTFSFIVAFGTDLGKYFRTGEKDFAECLGILAAIVLSVSITLIMEGSSEKAFKTLNRIYDNINVRAVRNGKIVMVEQHHVAVGDIILIENGEKIVADGRLIESNSLSADESALTGESRSAVKDATSTLKSGVPLAERKNCVYSDTFVKTGSGKMIVTAVGDKTEIGRIAGELHGKKTENSPLQEKLSKLGKTVSVIGASVAAFVFALSAAKLFATGNLNFANVRELFVSCIILIVAAVPEGLPTIVAVSLALNMIKLAGENALIKKMTATETAGAVSVICSDKTGTLTQNKMTVIGFCTEKACGAAKFLPDIIAENAVLNSTAEAVVKDGKTEYVGSGTESALLVAASKKISNINAERKKYTIIDREEFSAEKKYMTTTVRKNDGKSIVYLKGAPEKVLSLCRLGESVKRRVFSDMEKEQKKSGRIICFAHKEMFSKSGSQETDYVYDGYAILKDPVRPEVKAAVRECKKAGIKIKILTGDNYVTALAVAEELGIADAAGKTVNGSEIENYDDETLKKILPQISVVARSTPLVKLRVVKLLKELGEVVAVTGDGLNDAPAIKRADVGFAMGISGSEITKEAADVVLLDDSFATVVKAVSFGRNVYRNLQRFILFQLSVNLSALLFVTFCALLGLPAPFNTLQLLWINVIMDGPPALTLGLEKADGKLMNLKPVKRNDGIVSVKMFLRILFNGAFIAGALALQYNLNFLSALDSEKTAAIFTLFIMFQLFNAFNSRELGSESICKRLGKNRIMIFTFGGVLLAHIIIVQFIPSIFGVGTMRLAVWLKCAFVSFSIVAVSELYKFLYRAYKSNAKEKTVTPEVGKSADYKINAEKGAY